MNYAEMARNDLVTLPQFERLVKRGIDAGEPTERQLLIENSLNEEHWSTYTTDQLIALINGGDTAWSHPAKKTRKAQNETRRQNRNSLVRYLRRHNLTIYRYVRPEYIGWYDIDPERNGSRNLIRLEKRDVYSVAKQWIEEASHAKFLDKANEMLMFFAISAKLPEVAIELHAKYAEAERARKRATYVQRSHMLEMMNVIHKSYSALNP